MSRWASQMERSLGQPDASPVLDRDLLDRYARSARGGAAVAPSTLTWWTRRAVEQEQLERIQRGLYLNRFRVPPGQLADAVSRFHKDAVVSLNTVLGDAGVLNNPTRVVTAVVPIDTGFSPPQLGRKRTKAGTLHFFGIPRRILDAGRAADRLQSMDAFEHLRATPEKALIDWLYLGRSARSKRTMPPHDDIDMQMLDHARLRRVARAGQMADTLDQWLERLPVSS